VFIANLLYDALKPENFKQQEGLLKSARERASNLPYIGVATVGLHFLINGTFFSLGYFLRNKDLENTSFLAWMAKKFVGKKLCDYLAMKIVELVYHPSWSITLLQLIDSVIAMQKGELKADKQEITAEELKPLTEFLFHHFSGDKELLQTDVASIFDYFSSDQIYSTFQQICQPQLSAQGRKDPQELLENMLEALLPTIRELQLYSKVTSHLRQAGLAFEDDSKFWEMFIRETLNRLVSQSLMGLNIKINESAAYRNTLVEKMLAMDTLTLHEFLAATQNDAPKAVLIPAKEPKPIPQDNPAPISEAPPLQVIRLPDTFPQKALPADNQAGPPLPPRKRDSIGPHMVLNEYQG
jgi:hypothetical protein